MQTNINKQAVTSPSVNADSQYLNRRQHERIVPKTPDEFIIQRAWTHFIQIHLFQGHQIIGKISDISLGGLACEIAYEFDLVDPVVIDISLNLKSDLHGSNCFKPLQIPAMILRSTKDSETELTTLGIKFMLQNDNIKSQIAKVMNDLG